jgi:hypothetical protein
MATETYTLGGLQKLTGYSRIRLDNDKAKAALTAAGATIGDTGNEWAVTLQNLIDAELVQPDGTPFEVKKRGGATAKNGAISTRKAATFETLDFDELAKLLEAAKADEAGYGAQVEKLEPSYKDAKKLVSDFENAKEKHAAAAKDVRDFSKRYDRMKDKAAKEKAANVARLRAELEKAEAEVAALA